MIEKLIFGSSRFPAKEGKTRKKEVQTEIAVFPFVKAIEFTLCTDCAKVVKKGNISKIMPVLCDKCRYRFLQKANHEMVIGGIIEIV